MSKFRLLLILLPLIALYAAKEAYSWTSRAALAQELDLSLGPWGSWLLPWLERLGPEISQGVGAYFHARKQWQWSWPAALVYGFPGALVAIPMLVGGLGLIAWKMIRARFTPKGASTRQEKPADTDGRSTDLPPQDDDLPH